MRYAKRWLAAALLLLVGVSLLSPVAHTANTGGFVDFYAAYGTTFAAAYPNGYDPDKDFAQYAAFSCHYPIPQRFRFEVAAIINEKAEETEKVVHRFKDPMYIEAELGEVTTAQVAGSFVENGIPVEMCINLAIQPLSTGSSYHVRAKEHGRYKIGDAPSYNQMANSSWLPPIGNFEGYPYTGVQLATNHHNYDYILVLKLIEIVPGDKLTNQTHMFYTGETEYKSKVGEEWLGKKNISQKFIPGTEAASENIRPAYSHMMDFDKETDTLSSSIEVLWTGWAHPTSPYALNFSDGDASTIGISSDFRDTVPDRLFFNDTITVNVRAFQSGEKAEVMHNEHPDSRQLEFWISGPGMIDGSEDFFGRPGTLSSIFETANGEARIIYRAGDSFKNEGSTSREIEVSGIIRRVEGFDLKQESTLTAHYGDWFSIGRKYAIYEPPIHDDKLEVPEDPGRLASDPDDAPQKGGHQSVDTRADKSAGETGVSIPGAIATAILGGAAAMAGAGAGGDENKKKNRYEMRLRKEFGDTILIGGQVAVYARIVEITPNGTEISRGDLTEKISIRSPSYLVVSGEGMSGEHKAAYIDAPETAGEIPTEAVVSFRFADKGSSFTNHVTFQIGEQKIFFGQENLTLPAGYDKTERLPFAVLGMEESAVITASVIREDGYSVQVEPGEEPGLYYALITEKSKTTGEAGDYDSYTLEIKAVSGDRTITGELPLYRFHMGLRLDMSGVGCYIEEYDPANHQSTDFLFSANGKQYVPAETKATLTLYDWDIENHKIFQVAPVITDYKIQAAQEENQLLLEKIAVQCQVLDETAGGSRGLIFRCCKGMLDAPNRFEANITLTVTRDGEEDEQITVEKEVLMRSQPPREHKSTEEGVAAIKADRHLTERLEHIRGAICAQGYLNNLFPLVKIIDVMLSGYDEAYGYDAYQLETVQNIWEGFLVGDIKGANTEPETFTIMGELWSVLTDQAVELFEKASAFEQSLSFLERLALGCVTFGKSEVAFTAIAGIRTMKEYVEEGGDSALEAFRLGAKVATVDYLIYRGAQKALGAAAQSKTAVSLGKTVKKAAVKSAERVKQFSSAVTGRTTKTAISNSVNAKKLASAKAETLLESGKRGVKKTAEQIELDKSLRAGREFATEQVENLRAAEWQYRLNPTDANRKLLDNLTIKVQQNKLAMYRLQDYADEGLTSTRKAFNETLASFYSKADTLSKSELSAISGVPANQIKIVNASASSRAMLNSGKKVTMDRDWTAYYIDSKGQTVYFDQITTTNIYNKNFYKAATGAESADLKIANRFAKKTDQTVIQDIQGHLESYGSDLHNVMDKSNYGKALNNPKKVASSVSYKGKERFAESDWLLKQAESITDAAERELARAHALGERMEGYRQLTKQFDNFIRPRDVARRTGAEISKIPENMHTAVELCRKQLATNSTMSVSDLENGLRALGFTPESFADALGDAVLRIG